MLDGLARSSVYDGLLTAAGRCAGKKVFSATRADVDGLGGSCRKY